MSQLSKKYIHKDVQTKIVNTFLGTITKLKSENDLQDFLNDLLSPTEKAMLAKRLAIAVLLAKGYGYEIIKDSLKVSSGTISKVALILNESNGYRIAIQKLAQSQANREFWQDIERLAYRMSSPGNAFIDEDLIKHKLGHRKKTLL